MPQPKKKTEEQADAEPSDPKKCFVICPFGRTAEERKRARQVYRHLIELVLVPEGFDVGWALDEKKPGMITRQIIDHLLDDDLVVADLTGQNPNVFYELAIRHAAHLPSLHIMTEGQEIPFDLKDQRLIMYALDDPDRLVEAQDELREKVRSIALDEEDFETPLGNTQRIRAYERGGDETREQGAILAAIEDLQAEVRANKRAASVELTRTAASRWRKLAAIEARPSDDLSSSLETALAAELMSNQRQRILSAFDGAPEAVLDDATIAEAAGMPLRNARRALDSLQKAGWIEKTDDGRWRLP